MSVLAERNYLGDWLVDEFSPPNYCRAEVTVLAEADLPSGQVLGVESDFVKYAPYDNSDPADAAAILVNFLKVNDAKPVTTIADLTTTATVTMPAPHGLVTGDIVKISGATVDPALNGNYAATVTSTTVFTVNTGGDVADDTYSEATLRITKLNHNETAIVRGPVVIAKAGLNWGTSDDTGITDGLAELLLLGIRSLEGV